MISRITESSPRNRYDARADLDGCLLSGCRLRPSRILSLGEGSVVFGGLLMASQGSKSTVRHAHNFKDRTGVRVGMLVAEVYRHTDDEAVARSNRGASQDQVGGQGSVRVAGPLDDTRLDRTGADVEAESPVMARVGLDVVDREVLRALSRTGRPAV